jgi:biofilm PGA synthesis N-glycosyltransferase PgaC
MAMSVKINKANIKKFFVYGCLYVITLGIVFSTLVLVPRQSYDLPVLRFIIICFASILLAKYFLYMLISPWHDVVVANKNRKYANAIRTYNPLVSVMVPAWNEATGILETTKTILKSTYRNVELIVVNDGSTDNSDVLMRAFIEEYNATVPDSPDKIRIVYHYKENGGKGEALNTSIKLSQGDILMSIDADCVVMEDTIGNFVRCFVDPKVMAAVGNVKVGNTNQIIGVIQHLEFLFSFYFKKADSVMNTIYIIGGAAGAFRREVFEQLGLYNTKNITEDIELSVRIQDAGMKIVYASDAIVYTEGASKLRDLMKQRLRWKRGRFETFRDHKDLFFSSDKKHNLILSWIVMPLAYFGELQLSLELFFLAFLYFYSVLINDFSSFISGIVVVGSMFFVQIFFDDKKSKKFSFYMLSPIGWLLFYVATFVEFNALIKSIWGLARKQELKWQKWQRQGVHG